MDDLFRKKETIYLFEDDYILGEDDDTVVNWTQMFEYK